jgi:hypothetical protein
VRPNRRRILLGLVPDIIDILAVAPALDNVLVTLARDGIGRGGEIKTQIRPGGISRQGGGRGHHLQVREGSSRLRPG